MTTCRRPMHIFGRLPSMCLPTSPMSGPSSSRQSPKPLSTPWCVPAICSGSVLGSAVLHALLQQQSCWSKQPISYAPQDCEIPPIKSWQHLLARVASWASVNLYCVLAKLQCDLSVVNAQLSSPVQKQDAYDIISWSVTVHALCIQTANLCRGHEKALCCSCAGVHLP